MSKKLAINVYPTTFAKIYLMLPNSLRAPLSHHFLITKNGKLLVYESQESIVLQGSLPLLYHALLDKAIQEKLFGFMENIKENVIVTEYDFKTPADYSPGPMTMLTGENYTVFLGKNVMHVLQNTCPKPENSDIKYCNIEASILPFERIRFMIKSYLNSDPIDAHIIPFSDFFKLIDTTKIFKSAIYEVYIVVGTTVTKPYNHYCMKGELIFDFIKAKLSCNDPAFIIFYSSSLKKTHCHEFVITPN